MIRKETILATIFIFLLLFRPSIIPIDVIYVLTGFSLFMLFREARHRDFTAVSLLSRALASKYFRVGLVFAALVALAFAYNWILHGIPDKEVLTSLFMGTSRLAVTFLLLPINLAWLLIYCKSKNVSANNLLRIVLYAIILQLICVLGAYLLPFVKDFFIWLMQINGNWSNRWTENRADDFRMFGFAKSLVDTFGFGMGILSAVPWILAYRLKSLKYLLVLPIIFFAIFVNARTGIIIMAVTTIPFLALFIAKRRRFFDKANKSSRQNRRVLVAFCLVLALTVLGVASFMNKGGYFASNVWRDVGGYVKFVMSGGDVSTTRGTQASTNFSNEFWIIPADPLQLFIGAGQSVYGPDSIQESSSDVGYINNIWLFGLIGTVAIHILMILILWRHRLEGAYGKVFAIVCIVSIALFQVKASAFWSANLGISSIMLLYFIGYYEKLLKQKKSL